SLVLERVAQDRNLIDRIDRRVQDMRPSLAAVAAPGRQQPPARRHQTVRGADRNDLERRDVEARRAARRRNAKGPSDLVARRERVTLDHGMNLPGWRVASQPT